MNFITKMMFDKRCYHIYLNIPTYKITKQQSLLIVHLYISPKGNDSPALFSTLSNVNTFVYRHRDNKTQNHSDNCFVFVTLSKI